MKEESELFNYLLNKKTLNDKDLENIDHTLKVGTYFYRPPFSKNNQHIIEEKADIYSLGIIIFEMWHPFKNKYERFKMLTDLRNNNKFPKNFE